MTSKSKKVISLVLALFLVLSMSTMTLATNDFLIGPGDIKPNTTNTATKIQSISGLVLGVAQVIGVSVAVIMLIVLAIKYISSAPNDKAEIKKNAITYVVGAIVLFAAAGLLQLIKGFADYI